MYHINKNSFLQAGNLRKKRQFELSDSREVKNKIFLNIYQTANTIFRCVLIEQQIQYFAVYLLNSK